MSPQSDVQQYRAAMSVALCRTIPMTGAPQLQMAVVKKVEENGLWQNGEQHGTAET